MVRFFESLPMEEKGNYKFCFTARHTSKEGRDVMLLQNNIFMKWDEAGKPLVKLILYTDISAYKKDSSALFYITRLNETGELEVVPSSTANTSLERPSVLL